MTTQQTAPDFVSAMLSRKRMGQPASDACDSLAYAMLQLEQSPSRYAIERVIFRDLATIVFWADGTKTVARCGIHDKYDPEKGVMACIAKRAYGNGNKLHAALGEAFDRAEFQPCKKCEVK